MQQQKKHHQIGEAQLNSRNRHGHGEQRLQKGEQQRQRGQQPIRCRQICSSLHVHLTIPSAVADAPSTRTTSRCGRQTIRPSAVEIAP